MTFLQPFAISSQFSPATSPTTGSTTGLTIGLTTGPTTGEEMTLSTLWFICDGSNLVVTGDCPTFPQAKTLESLGIAAVRTQFLGYLNGQPCVAAALSPAASLQGPFGLSHLRGLYGQVNEDLFAIAARAVQIVDWDRTHQYCGQCATPTIQLPTERAKRCPNCKLRQYPRLAPAVIMLISKGEEILLARAPRFRDGMYSVLAGFVEPGESLEETVTREVREEVSIEIQNIRYFGSQPWPFPNSLMVGFTAEYASGILTPEPSEIEDVAWFTKDNLPPVPGKLSIARKLIDWFIERQ